MVPGYTSFIPLFLAIITSWRTCTAVKSAGGGLGVGGKDLGGCKGGDHSVQWENSTLHLLQLTLFKKCVSPL